MLVAVLFTGLLGVPLILTWILSSRKGAVYDSKTLSLPGLTLRARAHREDVGGLALPGAYYVLDARREPSDAWMPIVEYRRDDPYPLPGITAAAGEGGVAWIFWEHRYAVTRDAGRTWQVADVRDNPVFQGLGFVESLAIASNGSGVITLRRAEGEAPEAFRTGDFGRTWNR